MFEAEPTIPNPFGGVLNLGVLNLQTLNFHPKFSGSFFKNPDFENGQVITCEEGQWVDDKGQPTHIDKCVLGCRALLQNDIMGMRNATYIVGPPRVMVRT